jgi:hypothetical protein
MDIEDGEVVQCKESEADYFGVYIGTPGDLTWAADFDSYTDALNWALEVADNRDCTVFDYVQYEREECV